MTRFPLITLFLFAFFMTACAAGPKQRARDFSDALAKNDANGLSAMMVDANDRPLDAAIVTEALAAGLHADPPSAGAWLHAATSARVETANDVFLLAKIGDEWKLRCASAGPFHDRSPEMLLLLAVHLIEKRDFTRFFALAQAETRTPPQPDQPYIEDLAAWARMLSAKACIPFTLSGDTATLAYGPDNDRRVTLVRDGQIWKIRDLW